MVSIARLTALLAAVLVAVLTVVAPAVISPIPAGAQAGASGEVGSLRGCVEASEQVRVLYVMDESGSLQFTDQENDRITAAKFSLNSFLELSVAKPVEVRLAGFSSDYRDLDEDGADEDKWIELNRDTAVGIEAQIDEYAARKDGVDTDLPLALEGAFEALEPIDPTTCNLIVLFADGGYDIKPRVSADDQAQFGLEKPYAPDIALDTPEGVAEARRAGRIALCDDEEGTMSKVDEAGVRLITVALADSEFIDTSLLESLTTGRSEQTLCGSDFSGSRGVFSPVDADSLAFSFGAITGSVTGGSVASSSIEVCVEGDDECASELLVDVDSLISQFSINAQFTDPAQLLLLTDPNGESVRVGFEGAREVALPGAVLKTNWIDEQALTATVIPTNNNELVPGKWSVAAFAESSDTGPANLLVTRSGNLKTVIPAGNQLKAGETGLVTALVTTTRGGEIEGSKLDVKAVLTDTRSQTLEVELQDANDGEGTFSSTVEVPPDFIGPADVEVQVVGTTSDSEEFTDSAVGIIPVDTDEAGSVDTTSESLASKLGKLGILGLLLLGALLLWLFIWRRREVTEARFRLDGLSVSSTPVVIRNDGALFRIDGEARPLALAPADFHAHPDPTASRVVNLPLTTLKVHPAKHPFDERNATASADAPITSKYASDELRSTEIDAELGGLDGTWLFIMDEENSLLANADTTNPSYGSIAGELMVFIEQSRTDIPRLFIELPDQVVPAARLLLRDARAARATDVDDASTGDMLEWVDQWAGSSETTPSGS